MNNDNNKSNDEVDGGACTQVMSILSSPEKVIRFRDQVQRNALCVLMGK